MGIKELLEQLQQSGYQNIRVLDDGCVVGTTDLLYTRAVCIGLNEHSWECRYCYEDRGLATNACNALSSEDDEPLPGYVATRGR